MTLKAWLQNSWLVRHESSAQEIGDLFRIADRDLIACQVKDLPADWRLAIAYNAGLQAATAALAASGYRASRRPSLAGDPISGIHDPCRSRLYQNLRCISQETEYEQLRYRGSDFGTRSRGDASARSQITQGRRTVDPKDASGTAQEIVSPSPTVNECF